jgi:hypothetical protein
MAPMRYSNRRRIRPVGSSPPPKLDRYADDVLLRVAREFFTAWLKRRDARAGSNCARCASVSSPSRAALHVAPMTAESDLARDRLVAVVNQIKARVVSHGPVSLAPFALHKLKQALTFGNSPAAPSDQFLSSRDDFLMMRIKSGFAVASHDRGNHSLAVP